MSKIVAWIGIDLDRDRPVEKFISGIGGFVAIFATILITQATLGDGAPMVMMSMGASAVLLFGVPTGALSQPWPFLAGHLVGAFVGITCVQLLGTGAFSAAFAVGITISLMHVGRFVHPPGGATALTAVLGGAAVTDLGYELLVSPIAINLAVMLAVAVAVNAPFPWRRYPASWARRRSTDLAPVKVTAGDTAPPPVDQQVGLASVHVERAGHTHPD